MADFYPVLARAVSCLPPNDVQARRELYARARTIVIEHLRGHGLQGVAIEAIREQAALEIAILRIEEESRALRTGMSRKAEVPRPGASRAAVATPAERPKSAAKSLAKILQAVQSDAQYDGKTTNRSKALVAVEAAKPIDTGVIGPASAASVNRIVQTTEQLARAPNSLGTMFFAIAYAMAAIAFAGVTYIRCMVWIAEGVIGYPMLLIVMAITFAMFIVPPMMIFRRASSLPSFGFLLRFIYSASRRVF
jgi:hypothetical protein